MPKKSPGKVQKENISIKDRYHFFSVLRNYSPKISEYSFINHLMLLYPCGERDHMKLMPKCACILFLLRRDIYPTRYHNV